MRQEGYVVAASGDMVKIRVDRESACGGNCVSCKGCPAEAVIIECKTEEKLAVGDRVEMTMPTGRFLGNAALGYGFLTVLAICGAVLGYTFWKSEGASVLGALVGIILGIAIFKIVFAEDRNEIRIEKI